MVSKTNYDFAGWATVNDLKCTDGRVIRKDAFMHQDGAIVPLVYGHRHDGLDNVLGHALLENRKKGVYAYGLFNSSETGLLAKELVRHGDIRALSICAGQLKQNGCDVVHGSIKELSLVLAGANPAASIQTVIMHGADHDEKTIIYTGEELAEVKHADEDGRTIGDIIDGLTEEQKIAVSFLLAKAAGVDELIEHTDDSDDIDSADESSDKNNTDDGTEKSDKEIKHENSGFENEGGDENPMKQNAFDKTLVTEQNTLTHDDMQSIITMAKSSNVGSLKAAMAKFASEHKKDGELAHAFNPEQIDILFPDYHDPHAGAPVTLMRDMGWVGSVMNGIHKSPFSRLKTRVADARAAAIRASGYEKGNEKKLAAAIDLIMRPTDPQTVYRKDQMDRDDILDITDFDVVRYKWGIMDQNLKEDLALAIMVGDNREPTDEMKIKENHIRPIWKDDDLYTIHYDVDLAGMRDSLQGTETGNRFGENYVMAESLVNAALYSREQYWGSGRIAMYCDPHVLNIMMLARDMNGRRIYNGITDLQAALNVTSIHTAEQFAGLTRVDTKGVTKKLLAIMVDLDDYHVGATKGGQITRFSQFDIDFNREKYLVETRLSGALIKPHAAVALEEVVDTSEDDTSEE